MKNLILMGALLLLSMVSFSQIQTKKVTEIRRDVIKVENINANLLGEVVKTNMYLTNNVSNNVDTLVSLVITNSKENKTTVINSINDANTFIEQNKLSDESKWVDKNKSYLYSYGQPEKTTKVEEPEKIKETTTKVPTTNNYGTYVNGYYRKNGTYVKGYYRKN